MTINIEKINRTVNEHWNGGFRNHLFLLQKLKEWLENSSSEKLTKDYLTLLVSILSFKIEETNRELEPLKYLKNTDVVTVDPAIVAFSTLYLASHDLINEANSLDAINQQLETIKQSSLFSDIIKSMGTAAALKLTTNAISSATLQHLTKEPKPMLVTENKGTSNQRIDYKRRISFVLEQLISKTTVSKDELTPIYTNYFSATKKNKTLIKQHMDNDLDRCFLKNNIFSVAGTDYAIDQEKLREHIKTLKLTLSAKKPTSKSDFFPERKEALRLPVSNTRSQKKSRSEKTSAMIRSLTSR